MLDGLRNKKIVVFGASGGIGSATVERLHEAGATVIAIARSDSELYSEKNTPPLFAAADVTSESDIASTFTAAREKFGSLDGLVNCVGSLKLKPLNAVTLAEWEDTLAVNLTSCFLLLKHSIPLLKKNGGSVVLISSAAGRLGLANHEAIAAAKAGVIGLMQAAAATYGRDNIRCNAVAPGLTDTPLATSITSSEPILKASRAMHALGREGQASEVASAICWLLSPEQSWMTGQTIGVDGGLSTVRSKG